MASPASSDEGEIRDGGVEKATTSLPMYDGTSVDRPDRNRSSKSNSMSPGHVYNHRDRDRRSRDRSRSPYSDRQHRGSKRAREEEYTDRSRGDPRRFRVHYEDAPQDYKRRPRPPYEDLDRVPAPSSDLRYDDRDRYAEKRPRTRSRSPYRADRGLDRHGRGGLPRRDDRYGGRGSEDHRPNSYGNGNYSRETQDLSVSKRGPSPLPADISRREAKTTQGYSQHHNDHSNKKMNLEKYVFRLWIYTFANTFVGQTILQTHLLPKLQKNLLTKQR
jgi:serine/threonine-protein kinase PRP4